MSLLSLFRRSASRVMASPGITHALCHIPSSLVDCDYSNPDGSWEFWTLRDYCNGTHSEEAYSLDGPGDMSPDELAAFAEELLGYPVKLIRFETEISEDDGATWLAELGYYLTSARW